MPPLSDLRSFENEWMEVEVLGTRSPRINSADTRSAYGVDIVAPPANTKDESNVPAFLCDSIDYSYLNQDNDTECSCNILR